MKMKDKEQIIFTPGLSSRSLTMDYYPIENMLIAGLAGSGKDTAINAIVKGMISSNDIGRFSYVYIDAMDRNNPLANSSRPTPYNELQSRLYGEHYLAMVYTVLCEIICAAISYMGGIDDNPKYVNGKLVVIVNNFGALPEYLQVLIRYLMYITSKHDVGINVIISAQCSEFTDDMLESAPYRITTRVTEECSEKLLNCNIGARVTEKFGTAWFYNSEDPYNYVHTIVKFTPEPLLNRMMKSYASGKPSNNKIVAKVAHAYNAEKLIMVSTEKFITQVLDMNASSLYEDFLIILDKEGTQRTNSTSEEIEEGTI